MALFIWNGDNQMMRKLSENREIRATRETIATPQDYRTPIVYIGKMKPRQECSVKGSENQTDSQA